MLCIKQKVFTPDELKKGYDWAYKSFYTWSNILKASLQHDNIKHTLNILLMQVDGRNLNHYGTLSLKRRA